MNFWQNFSKPIIGLAPMDGVTDASFRYITAKYGKPDVIYTEFVNVMGLFHGKLDLYRTLLFNQIEKPIVAQLFGSEPEYFYKAAHIICELGFDGIDINMGCPAKTVITKGGGASLINNPKLAQQIILKTKQGVKDWANGQTLENVGLDKNKIYHITKFRNKINRVSTNKNPVPISVKTRIGFNENTIEEWADVLIETKPNAVCVHGRTFSQLYAGKVDWEAVASVTDKFKQAGIVYIGNGNICSVDEANSKCLQYNLDGVLIGRATLGNPWLFQNHIPDTKEKITVLTEQIKYHQKTRPGNHFHQLKKHMAWYCKGFSGAKDLRIKLMTSVNYEESTNILHNLMLEQNL